MDRKTKPRIMYIDDDINLLDIVKTVLDRCGFECFVTTAAQDVVDCANDDFDVMIIDMIWPEMDNMDLCMDLIKQGYTGKIIIATTRNLPIEEWDVFDGLGFGLLMKPFGPRELIHRVRQALTHHETTN